MRVEDVGAWTELFGRAISSCAKNCVDAHRRWPTQLKREVFFTLAEAKVLIEHWHELQHVVQRRVLRYFRTHGLLDEADAHGMLSRRGTDRESMSYLGFRFSGAGPLEGERGLWDPQRDPKTRVGRSPRDRSPERRLGSGKQLPASFASLTRRCAPMGSHPSGKEAHPGYQIFFRERRFTGVRVLGLCFSSNPNLRSRH